MRESSVMLPWSSCGTFKSERMNTRLPRTSSSCNRLNGIALFPGFAPLENLYFLALVLAAALLVYARGLFRWPFGTPW